MQAIITRYHGPGNVRGARISARAAAGRVSLSWDHALNPEQNHKRAALQLVKTKMQYAPACDLLGGSIDGTGDMAWVFDHELSRVVIEAEGR